jgi:hypothetical protein
MKDIVSMRNTRFLAAGTGVGPGLGGAGCFSDDGLRGDKYSV